MATAAERWSPITPGPWTGSARGMSGEPSIAAGELIDLDRLARDLEAAEKLEKSANPHAVDLYFWTAMRSWQALAAEIAHRQDAVDDLGHPTPLEPSRALAIYSASLEHLLEAGQRFKRLDPRSHLSIDTGGSRAIIPIHRHGLVWQAEDYCRLLSSRDIRSRRINHDYRSPGVGVAVVGLR